MVEKNGQKKEIRKDSTNTPIKNNTKTKSDEKPKNVKAEEFVLNPEYFDFQICDWNSYHEIDGDEEERYVIQLFGRTEDDKDVCLKITGFTPFFYVEIPDKWTDRQVDKFVEILKNKVSWCTTNSPNYEYDLSNSLIKYTVVQKHKFYNFTNKKIFKFVMLVFKSHTAMREFANILARPLKAHGLTKEPMLYQRYESNIEPHIRFMHIMKLTSCGWVSIDKKTLKVNKEYSNCDHSYVVSYKDVKPSVNNNRIAPFKIMGYDIECVSCDHNFPQAERKTDKIIQIGITMYRYGSLNCYEQHILTMKDCDAIKGANVECYRTEKGLLRGFAKKITELRPDFKAGYNNFGFDDKYIFDRINRIDKETAKKTGTKVEFLENKFIDEILQTMGKVNNRYLMEVEGLKKPLTYFEIKNLSSSALGDNELKFFQVPGILSIDMMKVIQRDHRLIGYKLDNVSATFITEKANKIVEKEENDGGKINVSIYTKSTKALEKDSYIQIMVDDGYSSSPLSEGAKYKVLDIETIKEKKFNEKEKKEEEVSYQCIKTVINKKDVVELRTVILNPLLKIYWTFAKDDMHHTLINKYFKDGDPKKIKQIGKYCLKDCKLVNLLLAKQEIIVNSMGMANVCNVPLSYLFLRGQGVKIFSLVSKKCRELNFLIPVLRRKKADANGDDDETYEGATVITPKPAVYLSPIGVLDYSSLYPNSMRERNLSQECYVNNEKYDNLEGYIYHDVYITLKDKKGKIIKNIDGTPQKDHHRFAQKIISEEEINKELHDIFAEINSTMEKNIEKIKKQKYYSEDNRKDKINSEKAKLEKKIKEITKNSDLSDKGKKKQIENEETKMKTRIKILEEQNNSIKKCKEQYNQLVKEINENKKLSNEEKEKLINGEKNKLDIAINEINEKVELTDENREELVEFEKEKTKKKIADEKSKRFNVSQGQTVRYGILPEILTELLNKRKETNNRMGQEKDSSIKAVLNGLQLAYKVTANSLYGQTGAPTSPIFFIAIAASTTAIGRERLHYAKKIVEDNFSGAEVIYGDSVTGDTPLVLRDKKGDIHVTTIERLGKKWTPYEGFKIEDSNRKEKEQTFIDYDVMSANGWTKIKRVIRHKTQKKIYRITTNSSSIDVTEDHSLLDKNKNLIKPTECELGTELLHCEIYPSLHADDVKEIIKETVKNDTGIMGINANDKLDAQIIYYLLKTINYDVKINTENGAFKIIYSKEKFVKNHHIIKSIEYLRDTNPDEYVYDLETEDGTFHAGIGELIVKNTDSIFINFHLKDKDGNERTDRQALIDTIKLAKEAAKMINDNVPKPQSIVYEKTLHPFILVAKKKYVGLLFGEDPDEYYLKSMGIVLKRRDNAPIVKIVVGGIIDHILKNRDINKAVEYTKEVLTKLMSGGYPIDKFIISKTLRSRYKQKRNPKTGKLTSLPPHKMLADRMAERDPGNKPQINDRIPFVYIVKDFGKKKKKDILQGDIIEHPEYVIRNDLKIDYLYYLEHQIINPATQILELMLPARKVKKLFDTFIIEEENKRKGRQSMEKWMDYSKIKKRTKNEDSPKETEDTVKKTEPRSEEKKFPFIGNTKRHENQNMEKFFQTGEKMNGDDWEP